MLYLDLQRDDYVMIGDIRVRYIKNKGQDSISVEVITPDGTELTRIPATHPSACVVSVGDKSEAFTANGDHDRPARDGRPLLAIAR